MNEIGKILNHNEHILWEGKPLFWPFVLRSVFYSLFGLIYSAIGIFVTWNALQHGAWFTLFFPHLWIGLLMVVGFPLYQVLVFEKTHYAITNKRVIIQRGVIGRDFKIIDFDKITQADVNVGILDIMFGKRSGTIDIMTANQIIYRRDWILVNPRSLCNIPDPYNVFKFFKKVALDIKTDIQYPNKFRPQENPGYRTNYSAVKRKHR